MTTPTPPTLGAGQLAGLHTAEETTVANPAAVTDYARMLAQFDLIGVTHALSTAAMTTPVTGTAKHLVVGLTNYHFNSANKFIATEWNDGANQVASLV